MLLLEETYLMAFFQNPVTDFMEDLIMLHNWIMIYLIFILNSVLYVYINILYYFYALKEKIDAELSFSFREILILSNIRQVRHEARAETIWTLAPFMIVATIMIPSFILLYISESDEDPLYTFKAIGHQWYWTYETASILDPVAPRAYPNSFLYWWDQTGSMIYAFWEKYRMDIFDSYLKPESNLNHGEFRLLEVDNALVLAVDEPSRIIVTASDVLHSWALPSFGIKVDAVPGRLNQVLFTINREGIFYGQCSELCGTGHGFMPIKVMCINLR